jgi:PAS domain S-box-containing protein
LRRKDGGYVWVETEASVIYQEGKPYAIQGVGRDITKRKEAEEVLREAKDRLHSLFERIPLGLYRSTPEGKRLDANQALLKMARCPNRKAFLKGNIVDDYVNPEDRKKWQAQMELKGVVRGFEVQCRRHDGKLVWIRDSARTVRDSEGRIQYYEGAVEDITKRKQTEEALKNSLADWQSTFNSTEDLIMLLDKEFKIIRANLSTARFIGLDIHEILGKTCYQLLHKTKAPPDLCPLKKMKQTKKHEEAELYLAERDVWIAVSIDPVFNDKGNLIRCVHVIKDITERKKAEEARKQYAQSLAFLSRTAMEFVELPFESDIYQFIGKRLRELVGNSFVFVNSFDETTQCIQAQVFLGVRKEIESILKILKMNTKEMFSPISKEARTKLTTGKLVKVPGGLHVLSFEKIPKRTCTTVEKLFNLGDIYTMGFTRKGELFGNAVIITRDRSGLEKKDLIETFISQASVALQRKRAEEELKKYREHLEEMVEGRTAEIKAANERLQREIAERMNAERSLLESEAKLQKQKSALEQKNIALGEVIAQIEVEKRRIKDDIETNVNIVVSPILEKLKKENASAKYVNMLKYHLERLTSSFGGKITKKSFKLTPREIEVCNMVKGGLTSKDISNLLNISYRTIEKHRRNIRHKFGISNKRINLTSFLREF